MLIRMPVGTKKTLRIMALVMLSIINAFLFLVLFAVVANAAPVEQFDVTIKGTIQESRGQMFIIPPQGATVMSNVLIDAMAALKAHPESLSVYINSGGGEIGRNGHTFVQLLAKSAAMGTKVTCVVDEMAASLAMVIFSNCSERIMRPNSKLMWHSARVVLSAQTQLDQTQATQLLNYLTELNNVLWSPLKAILNDNIGFQAACDQEYVWPAEQIIKTYPQLGKIVPVEPPPAA